MIRTHRLRLAVALVFALLAASGLGVGLASIAPMLEMLLTPEGGKSLAQVAVEFNANPDRRFEIPTALIEHLPTDPFQGVVVLMIGLIILTLLGATANFLHQYLSQTITTKVVADVRRDAFSTVLVMPLSRVVQRGPTEFVARIIRDSAELQRGLIALVSKAVGQVGKGAAAFCVALAFNWQLTCISIACAPILAVALRKLGKRIRRGTRGSLEAQEGLLRIATESLQGLRSVKVNCAEQHAAQRFDAINEDVVHHELRIRTARALSAPLVEFLAVVAVCALVLVAAWQVLHKDLALQEIIVVLLALGVSGASFRPLAGLVNEMQAASAPAARLVDILEEPAEAPDDAQANALPRHAQSVAFENVGFTYPEASRASLSEISLEIAHGQRIAIVGGNGSGKTTLVSLLPRLLKPTQGRVLIDGHDIAAVSLASLRCQIGVVAQETVLIRGSVAENIAFGLPDVSREQIEQAAARARASEFIEALPGGYDADIAEQGASLSGGQRQRLAIARAVLRDPRILILDEATSQIDAQSEAQINDAVNDFAQGRTVLVIAHRLGTVLNSDRIVVMDAGRIVDVGTHDELLDRCDAYRNLAQGQLIAAGE
jgi:subfamily B ATP-binding cassette protein MsbA